jgi:23S rRNA (adenine2503-C2)-methyltransferase
MLEGESTPILAHASDAFVALAAGRGVAAPEALAVYRGVFRDGTTPPGWVSLPDMPVVRTQTEGTTRKFVQRTRDDLETETVILPQHGSTGRARSTLCVSSQVGCAMGCTFCETAQMGLRRNLRAEEIVAQWLAARFTLEATVTNVVFMGMGEPMDNIDAVVDAIRVLVDRNGPAVPASRITVSTVGHVDGIDRLAAVAREPGLRQLRLAVSLNAPNDEIRGSIMPLNRAMPMATLMDAMRRWPVSERQRVLIEYVLIPGVNDGDAHAEELCAYLRPLRCTINVIPYNPRRDSPWPAPADDDVDRFVERVRAAGGFVKRRQTMGRTVMGACGQLGNPLLRRPRRASERVG